MLLPRRLKLLLICLLLAIILGSCRTIPVDNIYEAEIVSASSHRITLANVKQAVLRADTRYDWTMKSVARGHIVATLNKRKHMAMVDITYNTRNYSITYRDSSNLKHGVTDDGERIHARYFDWVNNLDQAIRVEFNNL